jgi:hypothetical protein
MSPDIGTNSVASRERNELLPEDCIWPLYNILESEFESSSVVFNIAVIPSTLTLPYRKPIDSGHNSAGFIGKSWPAKTTFLATYLR